MIKSEKINIISIVVKENWVYGLGNDNMVYIWLADKHLWQLWA